jgi:hypothetical protein
MGEPEAASAENGGGGGSIIALVAISERPVATPEQVLPAPSCFGGGAQSERAEPEDMLGPSDGPSLTKSTYHCIETPNMAVTHQCPRGLKANGLELTGMD